MEGCTETFRYSHPHFNYDVVWVKDADGKAFVYYDKDE